MHGKGGSLLGFGLDDDFAVKAVELGTHHIQTDAPAGNFADSLRGGESRLENHFEKIFDFETIGFVWGEKFPFNGTAANPFDIQSPTVVANFDNRVRSPFVSANFDGSRFRLALLATFFREFDAVIEGIANQVEQGIVKLVGNFAIEQEFGPGELQAYGFFLHPGELLHHHGKAL